MSGSKSSVKREIPGWVGIVLVVFGVISLATTYWSPEALATATQLNIYSSAAATVIGVVLIVIWLATRGRAK